MRKLKFDNKRKKRLFLVIIGLILLLSSSFLTFDWTVFYFEEYNLTQPELPYTRISKVSTAFLIVILVWIAGKNNVFKEDQLKIRITFSVIAVGEIAFLFDVYILAVGIFGIIQFLLIWRNGQGLVPYFRNLKERKRFSYSFSIAITILIIELLLFFMILFPNLQGNPLFPIISTYAILLGISLWVGWMALTTKKFPKKNAIFIVLGMSFFFIADFLVGLNLSLPFNITRVITHYLTWIFYTPALLCIALSHYNLE
ncbi:MAG: putative YhhN-like protein [Promethearchaeota archaeon]|nr:MAG: putative YhhN-like protein [Candidatus Lokiarchaeota archaeon]